MAERTGQADQDFEAPDDSANSGNTPSGRHIERMTAQYNADVAAGEGQQIVADAGGRAAEPGTSPESHEPEVAGSADQPNPDASEDDTTLGGRLVERMTAQYERDVAEGTAQPVAASIRDSGVPASETTSLPEAPETPEPADDTSAPTAENTPDDAEAAPDPQEIFSSPESLVHALTNPETPPDVKAAISEIVDTWKEIEQLEASAELWDTTVKSNVDVAVESAVRAIETTSILAGRIKDLRDGTQAITSALQGYDNVDAARKVLQHANLPGRLAELKDSMQYQLGPNVENTSSRAALAATRTEEGMAQKQLLDEQETSNTITDQEAELLLDKMKNAVTDARSLSEVQRNSDDARAIVKKQSPDWDLRRQVVTDMRSDAQVSVALIRDQAEVSLGRLEGLVNSGQLSDVPYISGSAQRLMDDLYDVRAYLMRMGEKSAALA